jgi:hypothetical protein
VEAVSALRAHPDLDALHQSRDLGRDPEATLELEGSDSVPDGLAASREAPARVRHRAFRDHVVRPLCFDRIAHVVVVHEAREEREALRVGGEVAEEAGHR